jgi:hypothetical protein
MARFGLKEDDIYQGTNKQVLGYLFDQYVRACGFTPIGTSWVFIVKPDGECEFHPLEPDEPRWCCERATELSELVGRPTSGSPPWETARTWICPPPSVIAPNASAEPITGAAFRRTHS